MPQDKLEKFKTFIQTANYEIAKKGFFKDFKDDFSKSLKTILDYVLKTEIKVLKKVNDFIDKIIQEHNDLKNYLKKSINDIEDNQKKWTNEIIKITNEIKQGKKGYTPIKDVDYFDGQDGKNADENKIIQEILNKIPQIEELEIEKIKGLKEELEDLRNIRTQVRGGGTSALGIANAAKYFVKTEKPSGTINGTNRAFTVSKPIFAVLSFSLNGEFIAQLPNYTISNKTITFSEAIPAAYSGKDFEVVYI